MGGLSHPIYPTNQGISIIPENSGVEIECFISTLAGYNMCQ